MSKHKPKEPLLAVMLSVILVGLGQIYSTKVLRGIVFLAIRVVFIALGLFIILSPTIKIGPFTYLFLLLSLALQIYFIVDAYFCAKKYNEANRIKRVITTPKRVLLIVGILLFIFIFNPSHAIPLFVKTNLVQVVRIPTDSMQPALIKGDEVFVDKAIYKKACPKRGDIVLFKRMEEKGKVLVSRVAGLPNESVEIKNGRVLINGSIVYKPEMFSKIYYDNRGTKGQEGQIVKVPVDSYYLLGDDGASVDSRYFGCVPKKNIIGRAYKIYLPFKRSGAIK